MLSNTNANANATVEKCYREGKGSIGLNDRRNRRRGRRRKKAVPRADAGFSRQLKKATVFRFQILKLRIRTMSDARIR